MNAVVELSEKDIKELIINSMGLKAKKHISEDDVTFVIDRGYDNGPCGSRGPSLSKARIKIII